MFKTIFSSEIREKKLSRKFLNIDKCVRQDVILFFCYVFFFCNHIQQKTTKNKVHHPFYLLLRLLLREYILKDIWTDPSLRI